MRFFRESMSNRLNDDTSAIVIIMQRLHEGDVSGDILAREADCQSASNFDPRSASNFGSGADLVQFRSRRSSEPGADQSSPGHTSGV